MAKGYGGVDPSIRQRYFKHLQERKTGPHDPKNVKQQEIERVEQSKDWEGQEVDLVEVYVVMIQTVSADVSVGPVYFTRGEAEEECARLAGNSKYTDAWWVLRHAERSV